MDDDPLNFATDDEYEQYVYIYTSIEDLLDGSNIENQDFDLFSEAVSFVITQTSFIHWKRRWTEEMDKLMEDDDLMQYDEEEIDEMAKANLHGDGWRVSIRGTENYDDGFCNETTTRGPGFKIFKINEHAAAA